MKDHPVALKKATTAMARYPRAWDEDNPPAQVLYGAYDIAILFGYTPHTAKTWIRNLKLPLADGPDINGFPTWTRGLVLCWMYLQHKLPAHLVGEAQTFLATRDGKHTLESLMAFMHPSG